MDGAHCCAPLCGHGGPSAAQTSRRAVGVQVGLLLVTKQYLVLAGVALLRSTATLGVRRRRFLLGLSGAALVATVPFVLWY